MERAPVSSVGRLEQERLNRGWTQEYVAEQVGADPVTYRRWERGVHKPQPLFRQKLCRLFGKTAQDLGLVEQDETERHTGGQARLVVPDTATVRDASTTFRAQDLTMHLQSLVWSWLDQKDANARYRELQTALMLELEQKDNSKMNDDILSRRDALRRLALLPVDVCRLSPFVPVLKRPIEEILAHCGAGITACWQLRKGKDLAFAFDTVSWYTPTLEEIAATGSDVQRKDAAELLVQAFLLKSVLAWNLTTATDAVSYALQAGVYGESAKDTMLQILALRMQAAALFYKNSWEQALHTGEQALYLLDTTLREKKIPIPSLVSSYVYAGVATYQAQRGRKDDALSSLKKAHTTFFAQSSTETIPLWVDHSIGNLLENDGLTHFHLGFYKESVDSFSQIYERYADDTTVPLSCRVVSILEQVTAEALRDDKLRDMERCIDWWTQGIQGAIALQSEQKFNEAVQVYTTMRAIWPSEQGIRNLREHIVHW